ncbi:MAG: bifunctional precorrin-2 dehydrogenase/sirohydrochlorin ferrochelatase [Chloroflexi bacterium]|nr:MAG: siroheme synthase [Phototrophicales bacterium]RMF81921.1 MAG: bifunctional precorrin-2 dehydrogenase/sirohydrochlorin ferrochelatase [Chloroflexota bacterium]
MVGGMVTTKSNVAFILRRDEGTMIYPVMLNIRGRRCVVVGGGRVAFRKVIGLLNAGAEVIVISPQLNALLTKLVDQSQIKWQSQRYVNGLLKPHQPFVVIAATDSPDVNRVVADDAEALGALVNIVDESAESDFNNMAVIDRSPLTIAISTGGASPALTTHLKQKLDTSIGDEYIVLAKWMQELRSDVQRQIPSENARHAFWYAVIDSEILSLLRSGHEQAAHDLLRRLLSECVEAVS